MVIGPWGKIILSNLRLRFLLSKFTISRPGLKDIFCPTTTFIINWSTANNYQNKYTVLKAVSKMNGSGSTSRRTFRIESDLERK